MEADTLRRWLIRSIAGADRVQLLHRGPEDETRLVRSYPLRNGGASEELAEIARELIADAQDETDIAEVRCSFVIRTTNEADETKCTTKHRAEPTDKTGMVQQNAPHEPNKEGVLQMLMQQNARMHGELCAAPTKMRAVYEEVIRVQAQQIKDQREEMQELYRQRDQLVQALSARGEDDAELAEEIARDAAARSEAMEAFMATGLKVLERIAGIGAEPSEDTQPPQQEH